MFHIIAVVMGMLGILAAGMAAALIERRALRHEMMRARELVDAAIEGIVVVKDGKILSANSRIGELAGEAIQNLIGRGPAALIGSNGSGAFHYETELTTATGKRIPVEVTRRSLTQGSLGSEVFVIRDVQERNCAAEELRHRNEELQQREVELREQRIRFVAALDNIRQGLCLYDADQRVVLCNDRYSQMYGLRSDQTKPGTHLWEVVEARIAKGAYSEAEAENYLRHRELPVIAPHQWFQDLADGRVINITQTPIPGGGWVSTHEDVSERRRIEAKIAHMAHHDALTELPNRLMLRERLENELASGSEQRLPLALLIVDLDRFKEINDTLGHAAGDGLLIAIANRLREGLRANDLIARIGGDEFAVLSHVVESVTDAARLAARVHAVLAQPMNINGHNLSTSASIGIALAPDDANEPEKLLHSADMALSRAKADARGQYRFFEAEMDRRMQTRRKLEQELRNAIANEEFSLHYQPLIDIKSNQIVAFEALIRWDHPEHRQAAPAEFISLAEETGLIVPIGEWVLRRACAEAASWPDGIRVAVNLSAVQFKSRGLVQTVISALASSELAPSRLELEVTETVMLHDMPAAVGILRQFRDFGIRLALDDFGTGYSALSFLRSFQFNKIKIDRSFVSDLSKANPDAIAIVRSVAGLGASLGMATTAEGVETEEQFETACAEGCTEAQGFYLSPPLPACELKRFFEMGREFKPLAAA